MRSQIFALLAVSFGLAALPGPAAAAPWSLGAAALSAPSSAELATFWAKPYPYGYRWRRTPCYVYVWRETVYVKERVRTCR
jgi:hypothetical protein